MTKKKDVGQIEAVAALYWFTVGTVALLDYSIGYDMLAGVAPDVRMAFLAAWAIATVSSLPRTLEVAFS